MPGYTASHSACKKTTNLRPKFYGKTALNGEIPVSKYQNNINHIVILLASLPWMKTEHFMVSTLDFFRVFKTFFPKFELLNSGCGLSASLYGIQAGHSYVQYSTAQNHESYYPCVACERNCFIACNVFSQETVGTVGMFSY